MLVRMRSFGFECAKTCTLDYDPLIKSKFDSRTTNPHSKTKTNPPIFERPVRDRVKPFKTARALSQPIVLHDGEDVMTGDCLALVMDTWSRPGPGTGFVAQQLF